jgi:rhodanese-related sulfurtransferase
MFNIPSIKKEELFKWCEQKKKNLVIVDVRDKFDHPRGHIKGSLWISFLKFHVKSTSEVLKKYDVIIFHCMLSKFRAPTCAQKVKELLPDKEIYILEGGFQGIVLDKLWRQSHADFLEDFDPNFWDLSEEESSSFYDPFQDNDHSLSFSSSSPSPEKQNE